MTISIRLASESDEASVSRICLLTASAGSSAEDQHNHGEFPGLVYAVPYLKLPTTFGFVLIDDDTFRVVGYILGSSDTRAYERAAEAIWWPALRAKYPVEGPEKINGTEADIRHMDLFRKMHTAVEEQIVFSPAHIHIDILPEYQRQGWGRKLIGRAVVYLRNLDIDGLWVGLDPKNKKAKLFYRKLGFEDIQRSGTNMGLQFDNWKD